MAEAVITIEISPESIAKIKQDLRDIIFLEHGPIWMEFCEINGIGEDIQMKYLNFLNSITDGIS